MYAQRNGADFRIADGMPAVRPECVATEGFAAPGLCQSHAANSEVVAEGADANRIYKIVSGAVRTVRHLEDGRRQIGDFYLPGDIVGLAARESHAFAIEAVVDSTVAAVRRDRFVASVGMADSLLDLALAELERAQDRFTTLGRRSAIERVATFLLDMSSRLADGDTFDLPMCRQDIGDYLGLTIETVSRMMSELERRGIIDLPNSRRVIIADRAALMRLEG